MAYLKQALLILIPCLMAVLFVHAQFGGQAGYGYDVAQAPPGSYYNYAVARNRYLVESGQAPRAPFRLQNWLVPGVILLTLLSEYNNKTGTQTRTGLFG